MKLAVGDLALKIRQKNLSRKGPDADGFVAVLGTFAFISAFFGDVRVVLHATNLDVDGDPDADGNKMASVDLVNVVCTLAFISTYFGDVGKDLFFNKNLFT